MKIRFQHLFIISLIIGLALSIPDATRRIAYIFLFLVQPFMLFYYVAFFKRSLIHDKDTTYKLRYPLILALQLTYVCIAVLSFFSIMQWPFFWMLYTTSSGLAIVSLLMGVWYIVANKALIKRVFAFELIVLMMPLLILFTMSWMGNSPVKKTEYVKVLNKHYQTLSNIEGTLYKKRDNDTSAAMKAVVEMNKIKKALIDWGGGVRKDEDGYIVGSMKNPERAIQKQLDVLEQMYPIQYTSREQKYEVDTVIEYLTLLTEIQINILLKEND